MRLLMATTLTGMLVMTGCATTYQAGAPEGAIDIIAHRGASSRAPENTLASFRLAHEMRADWFELDCTLTKDGQVLVIHDDSVDRTTNGKGSVSDLTLEELKKLDAGQWKGPEFAGERLPTLAEALDFAKGRIGVYIEVKDAADDSELRQQILDFAKDVPTLSAKQRGQMMELIEASKTRNLELTRKVIQLVRERQMEKQVVIQSFATIVCAIAVCEAPDIRVEFLSGPKREKPEEWESALRWCYLLNVAGFNTTVEALDPGRLAAFQQAGKSVAVWTINDSATMRCLATWGVDAVITDRPDLCGEVLSEAGKR